MLDKTRVHTITVPWRKVCAALPAVALIGGGITLTSLADPTSDSKGPAASKDARAIVVPSIALARPVVGPFMPESPALELPEGTVPGSSTPVTLDSAGIPARALKAYREAASLIGSADPGCRIDWALLAAIGRVESDHARFAGNRLDSAGVAQPGIIGVSLNGFNGTARITDSDGGRLDGDKVYDRAVGPMQFIPSTWRVAGTDADGDSVKNPQDMADAATASAIYLCSGPGDLRRSADLSDALLRYNASISYVQTVIAIADAYRGGVTALPAFALPASHRPPVDSTPSTSVAAKPMNKPIQAAPGKPAAGKPAASEPAASRPGPTPSDAPAQGPTVAPSEPAPTSAPSTAAEPVPAASTPTSPVPTSPVPTSPVPADTSAPSPCAPALSSTALPGAAPSVPTRAVPTRVPTRAVPTRTVPTGAVPTPLIPCPPTMTPPTTASLDPTAPPTPPRRHRGRD